jgi:hypothetical protein
MSLKILQLQFFVTVIVWFYRIAKFPPQTAEFCLDQHLWKLNLSLHICIHDKFHWTGMIEKVL